MKEKMSEKENQKKLEQCVIGTLFLVISIGLYLQTVPSGIINRLHITMITLSAIGGIYMLSQLLEKWK